MDATNRERKRYWFWLDQMKPAEKALSQVIKNWKAKRQFMPKVRFALQLVHELDHGQTDLLLESYAWLPTAIHPPQPQQPPAQQPQPTASDPPVELLHITTVTDRSSATNFLNQLLSTTKI